MATAERRRRLEPITDSMGSIPQHQEIFRELFNSLLNFTGAQPVGLDE
jgi:hypothetical protein